MACWRSGRIWVLSTGLTTAIESSFIPFPKSVPQKTSSQPHFLTSCPNKKRTMLCNLFLIISMISWIHLLIASCVTFWLCRPCFLEQPPMCHSSSAVCGQRWHNRCESHGGLAAILQLLCLARVVLREEDAGLLEARWPLLPLFLGVATWGWGPPPELFSHAAENFEDY